VSEDRPVRVRVTGPRATQPRRTSIASEIDAQSPVGEIYMRSLMRSQLRLALGVVLMLAASVGSLPLLFVLEPAVGHTRLLGVPVPWLLLGFGVYPVLIALAWFYVRRAERNEAAFNDMVGGASR
jgi:hypothetical protein